MLPPLVHLVTDRRLCRDLVLAARAALAASAPGAVAIQLREKDLAAADLLALARALVRECRSAGQRLIVNDRIDVALAAGADGAHLPSAGLPPSDARRLLGRERLLGVSCHDAEDVRRALEGGADYATFSPIFDTPSKRAYGPPVGLDALREASRLGLPLVALGGIDVERAPVAVAAGARGVAAIRAWLDTQDPGGAVARLVAAVAAPR